MTQIAVAGPMPVVPPGVLGNPPATDVGAAEAFALAIQLAMGVVAPTGAAPQEQTAAGDEPPSDEAGTAEDGAEDGAAATESAAAPLLAALLPPVLPTVTTAAPTSFAAPQPDDASTTAVRAAAVPDLQPGAPAPDVEGAEVADTAPTAAPAETPPAATVAPDAPAPAAPAAQVEAPAAPAAVASPTRAETARPVAAQVIPEVTKLFSNGEGVQRVTLELNPRALGEVRVVLTVRHGDVHVRLAAGTEAREALAQSTHELTRALEQIGIKDHRLTLAELPGVAPTSASQSHSDTPEQRDQGAAFTGQFDTRHHHDSPHPRTGESSTAMDGTDHDHGSRTRGNRSIHEVSHVPSRGGVDLRM